MVFNKTVIQASHKLHEVPVQCAPSDNNNNMHTNKSLASSAHLGAGFNLQEFLLMATKLNKSLIAMMVSTALLVGCNDDDNSITVLQPEPSTEQPADNGQSEEVTAVKNVIMIIGDGMGPGQVGLLEEYATRAPSSIYNGNPTAMSSFANTGVMGLSANGPHGSLVVDSACSASQLATGVPSGSEMVGLDANGNPVETILEKAKAMGKATGLISDTRITHATPASFAAHQPHRSLENEIAVEMLTSGNVDVMLAGGIRHWIPQGVNSDDAVKAEVSAQIGEPSIRVKSKRKDDRNLLSEAADLGYSLAFNREGMESAEGDKLLGLFSYSGMMNGIAYTNSKDDAERVQPSLKEMTVKALDILAADPDGFFLMVEGGQIDWAGHNNDAATMLHELLKFDEAVQAVYDWVKDRNDTLVLITADHETGSFGFSYTRKDLPEAKPLDGTAFQDRDYKPNFNFGPLEVLDKLYQQKTDFYGIWDAAEVDGGFPTAQSMMDAINNNSEFKVTIEQAAEILEREHNEYYVADHGYLSATDFPKVSDFKEFYVYGDEIHLDLIGRKLAADQTIVWGTGTHTHTPVQVVAWGPDAVIKPFSSYLHHTKVGELAINAME